MKKSREELEKECAEAANFLTERGITTLEDLEVHIATQSEWTEAIHASMKAKSASQAAEKWGISGRRVQILCKEKRISGVSKLGYMWLTPKDAKKLLMHEKKF